MRDIRSPGRASRPPAVNRRGTATLIPVAMNMLANDVITTNTTTNWLASADVPNLAAKTTWNASVVA